jgi:branched-chain amino acid aminotransferase
MDQAQPLGFGNHFTPHMITAQWCDGRGWSAAEVTSHAALTLAPSAMVLHYGQAIFEGLKAYAAADGSLSLFRPRSCAERFNRSAARLSMPPLPEDRFIAACESLVRADHAQVPRGSGESLYLRPFMIATEASISVRSSHEYLFAVIASPVGSFFSADVKSISAWCPPEHARAMGGGTGAVKCAGNYAPSLAAKAEAHRQGCQEVLWLDAAERRWVEELSAMNFFCTFRSHGSLELATPPLSGTILEGNTRDSLLRLASRRGVRTVERPIDIAEIIDPDSTAAEAFACGTAATVVPISCITARGGRHQIGNGRPGTLTMQLRNDLVAIQEGQAPDDYGWIHRVRLNSPRPDPVGASVGPAIREEGRLDHDES